jgi:hypothetical protein
LNEPLTLQLKARPLDDQAHRMKLRNITDAFWLRSPDRSEIEIGIKIKK